MYVLDKDYDDHLGKKINNRSLYYWDFYSIENYLWNEIAATSLVIEETPKMARNQVIEKLNFSNLNDLTMNGLRPLAALYLLAQEHSLPIENCAEKIERRTSSNNLWEPAEDKIQHYRLEVFELAKLKYPSMTEDNFSTMIECCSVKLKFPDDIPGKHLCAILSHYLRSKFSIHSITRDSLVFRLTKNCPAEIFRSLQEKLQEMAI